MFSFSLQYRTLTPGHDAVQKVTLVPRGQARGLTWFIPADDPTLISKQQLFARIVGGLGGRAAEEVIFGEPEVTTGAAGDLQQITGLAKQVTDNTLSTHRNLNCCNTMILNFPLFSFSYFVGFIYAMNPKTLGTFMLYCSMYSQTILGTFILYCSSFYFSLLFFSFLLSICIY